MTTRTQSLIERVGLALESYHSNTGGYPSDGIESPIETAEGTRLMSGAALTFALTEPLIQTRRNAAGKLVIIGESEPLLDLAKSELTEPLDGDKQAVEMLDAWGNELHYDNLSGDRGRFDEQGDGSFHLSDLEDHEDDPRMTEVVIRDGAQNTGKFDLWSHGLDGHSPEAKMESTLANFEAKGLEEESDEK